MRWSFPTPNLELKSCGFGSPRLAAFSAQELNCSEQLEKKLIHPFRFADSHLERLSGRESGTLGAGECLAVVPLKRLSDAKSEAQVDCTAQCVMIVLLPKSIANRSRTDQRTDGQIIGHRLLIMPRCSGGSSPNDRAKVCRCVKLTQCD